MIGFTMPTVEQRYTGWLAGLPLLIFAPCCQKASDVIGASNRPMIYPRLGLKVAESEQSALIT